MNIHNGRVALGDHAMARPDNQNFRLRGLMDERGVRLELAQRVDQPAVIVDRGGFPAGEDDVIDGIAHPGVFQQMRGREVMLRSRLLEQRLGGWKRGAELMFVQEFLVSREDRLVSGQIIPGLALRCVPVDHRRVIVGRGAGGHLTPHNNLLRVIAVVFEIGGRFVHRVHPDSWRIHGGVLIPPAGVAPSVIFHPGVSVRNRPNELNEK